MSLNPLLFDHSTTLTKEIAFRSILLVSAAFSLWAFTSFPIPIAFGILTIGSGSKLFRALGFVLQKNGHTHVLGNAREKSIEDIFKIMTWNIAGVPGGFHYDHAGVVHWQKRIDQIAQKIKKEDPDVLVLQEVYDTALAEALIKKLNNHYAHFFIHLGATTFGSESGCMVLSKCGIHRFSNTDFKTNGWTLKRGFSSLEIKKTPHAKTAFARIIGTHFLHDQIPERRQARILQISQIFSYLQRPKESLPTFLVGDLNIERDGAEGKLLSRYLHHTYTQKEPTCTNQLAYQWDRKAQSVLDETIDYISYFKERKSWAVKERGISVIECHLSKAFDSNFDTKTALSDHHAIVASIKT